MSKKCAYFAVLAISGLIAGGCRQSPLFTVPVDLAGGLGTFEVTAGEPVQNSGTINSPSSTITVGSGKLRIDPADVSFLPPENGSGKGTTTMQSGGTFTVVVGVAGGDALATVCSDPVDEYGPFTVTVDEDNNIESITPDSVNLTPSTIDLINGDSMTICITVESTIDGTVSIDQLKLSLGL